MTFANSVCVSFVKVLSTPETQTLAAPNRTPLVADRSLPLQYSRRDKGERRDWKRNAKRMCSRYVDRVNIEQKF